MLHQDLSPSSPYSTRPRQIYTGHFIKEVRQWEDLLVARTSNSDLLAEKSPQIQEGLVNTGEHKREVAEPASAPDVDTNNTETSLASIGYGPPSDSIEHRSLQSLGREEPDLASGEGEGESSQSSQTSSWPGWSC